MKKMIISITLSVSILISLFAAIPFVKASETYTPPDVAILEDILNGDRHFVIDTLIGNNFKTDFSTNPYAVVNYIDNENTMMDNVLTQYQTDKAYKAAVDIMEKVYNSDEYAESVADFIVEFGADLLSNFSTNASNFTSDLTYSKSQLNYESILKEVLASDYTASDGTELSTKEIELENLERLEKGINCLKAFQAFATSYAKANHYDEKDEKFKDEFYYFNDYLTSYSDSIDKALTSFSKMCNLKNTEDIIDFVSAMGMVSQYDLYQEEMTALGSDLPSYAITYFVSDDDLKRMKFDKSVISGTSNALSSFMFIESIATQSDAMKGALTRISKTANPSLKPVLTSFANEIGKAGDAKLMGYESLMKALRDEVAVIDFAKWEGKKISDKFPAIKKFKEKALKDTAISKAISSATAVAGISSWCADKTMSFGDTCKKTYELKYLRTLIAQAIVTYQDDLAVYKSNKTNENAKAVLDDLLIIQKLRLRGENIAYKMTQGQWDSPLGRLLASGTLSPDKMLMDYLDSSYQARVDAFVGASAMPISTESFTIGNGESMTIYYSADAGLYANINKNGKQYSVAELQYKLINGITVNNGGRILVTSSVNQSMAIPFIVNNGGEVLIASGTKISELTQNSGTTIVGENCSHIEEIYLNGGTLTSAQRDNISCKHLYNTGGTSNTELSIYCTELNVSGTINGKTVYLSGDSNGGGGKIQNLYLCGSKTQTMNNITCAENITYDNQKGVTQNGEVRISGNLKNINTKIKNAKNTVLVDGGKIDSDFYKQDITIAGKLSDNYTEFDSIVYIRDNALIKNAKINNMIYQTGGTLTINGNLEIMDTAQFSGNVVQNAGDFILKGDATFSSATLNNLKICGTRQQSISGTVTVNDYINNNTAGLSIGGKINVRGNAISVKAPTSGASNVTLIDNGGFGDSKYYGDITIGTLSGSIPQLAKVYGNIYINGNITQSQTDTLIYALNMTGGNVILKDCELTLKNMLSIASGTLSLQNSVLKCDAALINSSTINIDENSKIEIKSDLINGGTINSSGQIKISGDISNSGTLKTNILTITAESNRSVSGNDINVNVFEAEGENAIALSNNIYVSDNFNTGSVEIDTSRIKYTKQMTINSNKTFSESLFLTSSFNVTNADVILKKSITMQSSNITIDNNSELSVKEDITLSKGNLVVKNDSCVKCAGKLTMTDGTITINDNATLMVRKTADLKNVNIVLGNHSKIVFYSKVTISGSSSNSVTVDETSDLTSKNLICIEKIGKVQVDGKAMLGSDAMLTSTALSGGGKVSLYGDLYTTSTTNLQVDTFEVCGKFAQRINGSNLIFNNLTVNNKSSSGVTLDNAICKGILNAGSSIINGTVTKE